MATRPDTVPIGHVAIQCDRAPSGKRGDSQPAMITGYVSCRCEIGLYLAASYTSQTNQAIDLQLPPEAMTSKNCAVGAQTESLANGRTVQALEMFRKRVFNVDSVCRASWALSTSSKSERPRPNRPCACQCSRAHVEVLLDGALWSTAMC